MHRFLTCFLFLASFLSLKAEAVATMKLKQSLEDEWKWQVLRESGTVEDQVQALCAEVDQKYRQYRWKESKCSEIPFKVFGWSVQNRPLVYYEIFEGPKFPETFTLIQCAIHGDELAAVPMCFKMIQEVINSKERLPQGMGLIVQPLLNPDGFVTPRPQRPNANGVDLNRNFKTPEWPFEAQKYWVKRDGKDPRKFPGTFPASEPETKYISEFIETRRPQKILSIHTPLGFLELDSKGDADETRRAKFLAINMVANSKNLDFKSYGVWPGSLGNYAGLNLRIPVYTMELPPGDTTKNTRRNWESYSFALWRAVQFDMKIGNFQED